MFLLKAHTKWYFALTFPGMYATYRMLKLSFRSDASIIAEKVELRERYIHLTYALERCHLGRLRTNKHEKFCEAGRIQIPRVCYRTHIEIDGVRRLKERRSLDGRRGTGLGKGFCGSF
jgi:hypothetical protein